MRDNLLLNKNKTQADNTNQTLKVTTLQYLKEALEKEEFEICRELTAAAKRYGAKQDEITEVLDRYVRGPKPIVKPQLNVEGERQPRF